GKLVLGGIVGILKTHRARQTLDRLCLTGEKMPATGCPGTFIAPKVVGLFRCRYGWGVTWGNAHCEHVKLVPDSQREHVQASEQAIEHQRAETWTLVVVQDQDHGFGAKILSKLHRFAGLIAEFQRQRELGIQVLLEPGVAQQRWAHLVRLCQRRRPAEPQAAPETSKQTI